LQQAVIIILLVSLGVLVGRWSAPNSVAPPEAQTEDDSAVTEDAGPREEINGVPVGYARTEEGAILAATNFARVMADPFSDSRVYQQAMETLASPEWRPQARELAQNTAAFALDRYGARGSISFSPLRYRAVEASDENAIIELWGVALASGPKVASTDESWIRGTIQLVWVDGDWRVGGQQSASGPTPRLFQNDEGPDFDVLDDFKGYGDVSQP
jgi:hypothetical protein